MQGKYFEDMDVKPGDVIVCVDDDGETWWTIGEEYTVSNNYRITDDEGDDWGFTSAKFVHKAEWAAVQKPATTVDYNDGKWHGWNGGERPVHPETVVDCLCDESEAMYHGLLAGDVDWSTGGAFRVIKEHKAPREFWIDPTTGSISTAPVSGYIHVKEVCDE